MKKTRGNVEIMNVQSRDSERMMGRRGSHELCGRRDHVVDAILRGMPGGSDTAGILDTASRGEKLEWLDMEICTETQHVQLKPITSWDACTNEEIDSRRRH